MTEQNKYSGPLYRDSEKGKIAGVCAGVANYFSFEIWLVRIIVVSSLLLGVGGFTVVAYIAAWFILDKKPMQKSFKRNGQYSQPSSTRHRDNGASDYQREQERKHKNFDDSLNGEPIKVKSKIWQQGEAPQQALHDIGGKFSKLEVKLRKMEKYVTSAEFNVNREINKL